MQQQKRWKQYIVALLMLGACSETPQTPTSVEAAATIATNAAKEPGAEVALGIAQALSNPHVRTALLQHFRASPWVEHKLVLQDFIDTQDGKALVAAAAAARGVTTASLTEQIRRLPLLDIYIPSRSERLTWRGEDVVSVALSTNMQIAPTRAFTSAGASVPFTSAHAPGRVLVLLHPAEAKGRRIKRQSAAVGQTVQDSDDGELGVQFIQKLANGDSVVHDLQQDANGKWVKMNADGSPGGELVLSPPTRSLGTGRRTPSLTPQFSSQNCSPEPIIPCDPGEGGGGSGGGAAQSAWTNVIRIVTRNVCDMDCTAGNEFEFRATAYNSSNVAVAQGTARITGVSSGAFGATTWNGNVPMIYTTVAYGVRIDVDIVETDPWPNPDDNFDPNPVLLSASDKARPFHAGADRGASYCVMGETVCKEVSVEFFW